MAKQNVVFCFANYNNYVWNGFTLFRTADSLGSFRSFCFFNIFFSIFFFFGFWKEEIMIKRWNWISLRSNFQFLLPFGSISFDAATCNGHSMSITLDIERSSQSNRMIDLPRQNDNLKHEKVRTVASGWWERIWKLLTNADNDEDRLSSENDSESNRSMRNKSWRVIINCTDMR